MRKLFYLLAVVFTALVVAACSNSDSPSSVAEKSVECIKNKDFKGYMELLYDKNPGKKNTEQEKEAFAALLSEKYESTVAKKDGIKSYKVISEEVKDSVAKVKMQIVFGNGETDDDNVKLRMTKDGEWKLDQGK